MKHLLNNLTEDEKNSIRKQHSGGVKVMNENFSKLVNTKLGDVKPLVNEQDEENLSKTQKKILQLIERGRILQAIGLYGRRGSYNGYGNLLKIISGIDWVTDENMIINISNIIKNRLDGEINVDDLFGRYRNPKLIIKDNNEGVEEIVVLLTDGVVVEVYPEDFDEDSDDYSLVTSFELPWVEAPSDILSDIFDALIDFVLRRDNSH